MISTSTFVLLDKLPANTANGYCFEPTYVHYDKRQVTIETAEGRVAASDGNYFGAPLTAQQQSDLVTLLHQYVPISRHSIYDARNAHTQPSQDEQTLCTDREEIYFSCPLENGKTVSVCAKDNTGPDRGYVQYRYGAKGDVFAFPNKNASPVRAVTITDVSEGSVRGLHLKFSKGPYTYVVSSLSPGEVYVTKNGKEIFDKACHASRYKSFSNKIFDGVREAPVSKIDIH
ncbi:hypothetical protein DWV00_19740 [Trinickia dinghuensis]|uniref:Uncharacterized protein n=2 Tax=Trinickia dinghuensis TaxID=2291023 RepID=A0A3D8JX43_9BURK|nr:hypothetical protein DWV00_19740 [Trinickia dinghuensis]